MWFLYLMNRSLFTFCGFEVKLYSVISGSSKWWLSIYLLFDHIIVKILIKVIFIIYWKQLSSLTYSFVWSALSVCTQPNEIHTVKHFYQLKFWTLMLVVELHRIYFRFTSWNHSIRNLFSRKIVHTNKWLLATK